MPKVRREKVLAGDNLSERIKENFGERKIYSRVLRIVSRFVRHVFLNDFQRDQFIFRE